MASSSRADEPPSSKARRSASRRRNCAAPLHRASRTVVRRVRALLGVNRGCRWGRRDVGEAGWCHRAGRTFLPPGSKARRSASGRRNCATPLHRGPRTAARRARATLGHEGRGVSRKVRKTCRQQNGVSSAQRLEKALRNVCVTFHVGCGTAGYVTSSLSA